MFYSEIIKTYNTINEPVQHISIEKGDFLTLKPVDKSKGYDGGMYFEILVFRRSTRECYSLWARTDELEIRVPVSHRVFEDGVHYLFVEVNCELSQMKSVRLH